MADFEPEAKPWEAIAGRLREVLADADMETMTERKLRKQMEEEFGCDLKSRKKSIRDEVEKFLAGQQGADDDDEEEEEAEEEEEEAEEKPGKRHHFGSLLSPAMQEFLGVEKMPRTLVVKEIWKYIKENDLQVPTNKRKIRLDDKLGQLFKAPLDMFNMNKQLTKHCFTEEVGSAPAAKKKAAKPAAAKAPKAAKRKREDGEEGGAPKKAGGGFTKPCRISPELAVVVGADELPRHEVVKRFWQYVKSNNLQNPAKKTEIHCDAALQEVTKCKTIMGFGAMKYFKDHMFAT